MAEQQALETIRLHLREVLVTTMPGRRSASSRRRLETWYEQNTYADFVDGDHWVCMIMAFESWAKEHRGCGPIVAPQRNARAGWRQQPTT